MQNLSRTSSWIDLLDIGRRGDFIWWCLHVTKSEIEEAEERYLDKKFPDRHSEAGQERFLHKFTTSPVFKEGSRWGNFRFTFHLKDLMQMYKDQICGGREPILRIHETVVFKQQIMYSVVVHSPDVTEFTEYPLLGDGSPVLAFREGKMIWHAEAMSETHDYQLITQKNKVEATECYRTFYMWDFVTLAFHLPPGQALKVKRQNLIDSLTPCEAIVPIYYFRKYTVISFPEAKEIVDHLKSE